MQPYDCIRDGVDGLLVDPLDSDGWYEAIKQLIDNPQVHRSMAYQALERIKEEYSWTSPAKALWLDAFRRIAR